MVNLVTVIKRTWISQCTGRASGNRLHSLVSSARCTWKPPSASNSAPSGRLCPEKKHPKAQILIRNPNNITTSFTETRLANSSLLPPASFLPSFLVVLLFSCHLQRNTRCLTRFTIKDLHETGNGPKGFSTTPTATVLNKSSGDLHSYACPWRVRFVLKIQQAQSDPEFSTISERQWVQQHFSSVLKGR